MIFTGSEELGWTVPAEGSKLRRASSLESLYDAESSVKAKGMCSLFTRFTCSTCLVPVRTFPKWTFCRSKMTLGSVTTPCSKNCSEISCLGMPKRHQDSAFCVASGTNSKTISNFLPGWIWPLRVRHLNAPAPEDSLDWSWSHLNSYATLVGL